MDDEEFCLTGLKVMLMTVGINIGEQLDMCMSGAEALALVKKSFEEGIEYGLIITDL